MATCGTSLNLLQLQTIDEIIFCGAAVFVIFENLKKLAAISLLVILLFNTMGYRFLINRFESKADDRLERAVDNFHYNEADLVEITIPLNMPYYADKGIEYVSGKIEAAGKHYQYVKRKVENNTLHIWCIANTEKNKYSDYKANLAKSSSENNPQDRQNPVLKLLQAEYIHASQFFTAKRFDPLTAEVNSIDHACTSQFNPGELIQPPEYI